jgi:hypothetical protein
MEAMLDLRAHAGLGLFQLFLGPTQRILLKRLAHAQPHRHAPVDCLVYISQAPANALVAVTE